MSPEAEAVSTEQMLVERLKTGDRDALRDVFETYSDRLYRLALRILNDEDSAEGVVQDTFISLIEKIDGFHGRSRIGTWLHRVAYNNAIDRLRKGKGVLTVELVDEPDVDADQGLPMPANFCDWSNAPETILSSAEGLEQMESCIHKLPDTLGSVFVLRQVNELSTSETANVLGLKTSAVKVRLHRARLALRECLSNYYSELIEEQ